MMTSTGLFNTFHGQKCAHQVSMTNLSSSPGTQQNNTKRLGGSQGATSHEEVEGLIGLVCFLITVLFQIMYADVERIHFSHSLVAHPVQSGVVMCFLEYLGLAGKCASQTRDGHHAHHSRREST